MHRLLRSLHLYVGLFVLPYALMYAVSAFHMSHPQWLPSEHVEREWTVALTAAMDDAGALARELKTLTDLDGAVRSIDVGERETSFRLIRIGTECRVAVDHDTGLATVRQRQADFVGLLDRMHHVAGWHHHLPSALLALTLLGVAVAMTFLGVTGIYLWFKLRPERSAGWVVLAVGLIVGVGLQLAVRFA